VVEFAYEIDLARTDPRLFAASARSTALRREALSVEQRQTQVPPRVTEPNGRFA